MFFIKDFFKVAPTHLPVGGKSLPLTLRQNARAKKLTLRWHPEGKVILTVPPQTSKRQIGVFVQSSLPWIEKQQEKYHVTVPQKLFYENCTILPVLGKMMEIRHKPSSSFRFWWGEDHLLIHAPVENFGSFVEKSLYKFAHEFLQAQTLAYAHHLGESVHRITLRDTRSRWGSCSAQRNISYSWRLIFAPKEVARYVCAHEVVHLREMNHGPEFWQLVATLCPDYKDLRQWLRKNGKTLFQYSAK